MSIFLFLVTASFKGIKQFCTNVQQTHQKSIVFIRGRPNERRAEYETESFDVRRLADWLMSAELHMVGGLAAGGDG